MLQSCHTVRRTGKSLRWLLKMIIHYLIFNTRIPTRRGSRAQALQFWRLVRALRSLCQTSDSAVWRARSSLSATRENVNSWSTMKGLASALFVTALLLNYFQLFGKSLSYYAVFAFLICINIICHFNRSERVNYGYDIPTLHLFQWKVVFYLHVDSV